jgi:RNA-directed DNA polymerase
VNQEKGPLARYQERGFLGFGFTSGKTLKSELAEKSLEKYRKRVRQMTRRSRGVKLEQVIEDLWEILRGWDGYFRLTETPTILWDLDCWIRRSLRCFMVKWWINNCRARFRDLVHLGVNWYQARMVAASRKGPWAMSNMKPLKVAISKGFLGRRGLSGLLDQYQALGKAI